MFGLLRDKTLGAFYLLVHLNDYRIYISNKSVLDCMKNTKTDISAHTTLGYIYYIVACVKR